LLPHDQDTGGFFVCVLEKAGPAVPSLEEAETTVPSAPETPAEPTTDAIVADEAGVNLKRAASPVDVDAKRARQVSPAKVENTDAGAAAAPKDSQGEVKEETTGTQPLPPKPVKREPPTPASQKAEAKKIKKERKDLGFKEDPYSFVNEKNEEVEKIV
jgi:multisite-specific tRNA:(cytosine-C5)-methyltransferase